MTSGTRASTRARKATNFYKPPDQTRATRLSAARRASIEAGSWQQVGRWNRGEWELVWFWMAASSYVKKVSNYAAPGGIPVGKGMAHSAPCELDAQLAEYMGDIVLWSEYRQTDHEYGIRLSSKWVLDGTRLRHMCHAAMCNDFHRLTNRKNGVACSGVTCKITSGTGEDEDRQYLVSSRPCPAREHLCDYGAGFFKKG
ncbi:hypothetical protein B484DRAFT_428339 [Ochromonadaceae sp. CCMP2298]|nr:hypothetical protein B484DRAFT_428339 [Ochromonadaceae sp. CCMP2298]